MTITLKCWCRLGDILLCFSAAKQLHDEGNEVLIECKTEYHDIFACVDYVKPVAMYMGRGTNIVMGVHPNSGGTLKRYLDYRKSGQKWQDWVYAQSPVLHNCPRGAPLFTRLGHVKPSFYSLPKQFTLAAPYGYSQIVKYRPESVMAAIGERHPGIPLKTLSDAHSSSHFQITARRLSHLPDIINWATGFASINSAPAIIAAGLGRSYLHFPQTGEAAQDDTLYLAKNGVSAT